jgi:hypothetical protein
MRDSLDTLLERLRGALERAERGDVESGEPLEYVLTEGYAYAMSLESEMQRVERRVAALAGAREVRPRVLKALTQRRREVAREQAELRPLLAQLQQYTNGSAANRGSPSV